MQDLLESGVVRLVGTLDEQEEVKEEGSFRPGCPSPKGGTSAEKEREAGTDTEQEERAQLAMPSGLQAGVRQTTEPRLPDKQ
jgi:hypothetical protein